VSFRALTAPSRVRNLATFSIDPQKRRFSGFETAVEASKQASRYNENGDEYAGNLTGLAFQSHSNSHRGHIFATSNLSAIRIHSPPTEKQICTRLSEI
jgi:hypothetical protein